MSPSAGIFRRLLVIGAACCIAPGCVTEREGAKRTGISYRDPAASVSGGTAPVAMPSGPIATPAPGHASLTARVQVPITPLGQVAFDAQVLPLISPDARFIAVEEGESPSWDLLLGKGGSLAMPRVSIAVYDASAAPARRLADRAELPHGVLLGRAADARGFLVEWARDDGSRWIGRVSWVGGAVEWLTRGEAACAHGVLTPQGELVFTRAVPGGEAGELVILSPGGAESARPAGDGAFMLPMVNAAGDTVMVMRASAAGLEIQTVRLLREGEAPARWGPVTGRRLVAPVADPQLAYQVVASSQGPFSAARGPTASRTFVVFEPALKRMAILDPVGGSVLPLAPGSIAAAPWKGGFLCTTGEGLIWIPTPAVYQEDQPVRPAQRATIVDWVAVPRVAADGQTVLLLGPSPLRADQLILARLEGAGR